MRVNIEAERVRNQYTKEVLSKMLGITSKTYLGYVRGDRPTPSDVLIKMSKTFHCSADYLLGLEQ
ncbi:MAG: helix-turn-helix transcriptional regulator [Oscillospiraceae bacterium]|jgi:transcriptional regulator with XRE-family HTH domain|nr:helix-turn-helix transcriptional regulator [Oscillospiraceae bacterium]